MPRILQSSTPGNTWKLFILSALLVALAPGCATEPPPEHEEFHWNGHIEESAQPTGEPAEFGQVQQAITGGFRLPWGCNETYGCSQGNQSGFSHTGKDLYAWDFTLPRGSNVRAAKGGVVTLSINRVGPGQTCYDGCGDTSGTCCGCFNSFNQVNVRHDDGTVATYIHLDRATAVQGTRVNAGDVLGTAGTSGCSTGTHLHFMVMVAGCDQGYCQSIPISFDDVAGGIPVSGGSYRSGNCGGGGGGPMKSTPQQVARDAEGRITLVARSSNGTAFFKRQSSSGSSSWSAWTSLGGTLLEEPVIARNANGRLTAFGIGNDRALYINHQSSSTSWTGWIRLGGSFGSHVVVGTNRDGRLEVFGRGTDNALWRSNQTSINTSSWTAPVSLGGALTSDPTVGLDKNGFLNVFLVGTSGRFFRIQQTSSSWSGFVEMTGIVATSAPSVSTNWDGRLEVYVRRSDNALAHAWHTTTAATAWSSWGNLGGILTAAPSAARNINNRIEVFVRNDRQGVHRIWQHTSTGWTGWVEMGGVVQAAPAIVNNGSNNLEIYVAGGEGFYRQVQLQVDGNWTNAWELLGKP
jgi:hypothetical protein